MGTIQGEDMDPIFICLVYNPLDVSLKKNSDTQIRDLRRYSENF